MDAKRWLLTVVYASPCSNVRTSLWKYFDGLAAVCNLPWLLIGDFNDIVCGDEKLGGNLDVGGQHFIEWLDRNHLIDLGFSGSNFTWCNKRGEKDIIWKLLDRGLYNIDWRFLFSEAHLSHLPRVNSDHCPIMVKFFSNHLPATESMPFRFQAMWLSHPRFSEFLSGLWNSGTGNAFKKSASLIWPLQRWNKQVFVCLFQKKRRILARFAGIQRSLCMQFNHFLSQLETDLTTEHNRILDQEEVFWLQKSRNTWLKEGLFSEPTLSGEYSLLPQYFPELEHFDCTRLNGEVSDVEIQSSLFAIGGLKTSGPDRFPALFYQNYWDLCSKDIIALVKDCFVRASLLEHLNDTLIALVPKVERPLNMAQLRPISLCNTLYKVVSKILVSRLRPIMTKIVSPTQVSFVPGRHIVDNIVIAQEMLHKFKNIASISGSPLSDNLGKYLGVPLIHTRVTKDTYQEIIDKVQKCLSSWKSHTLSMAGRLTLLQSVASAIPIYSMQTAMLPASVWSKLDQLNKNFLWGHAFDKVKVHLVNWEIVCKSKCDGGLGVKKATWMNQALLAKFGWRLLHNDQGLWAKVLKAKYLKNCDMLSVNEHKFRNCSSSWRGVLFGAKLLPSDVK
ncbi:unnamed protein product [Prunus armeniaca]